MMFKTEDALNIYLICKFKIFLFSLFGRAELPSPHSPAAAVASLVGPGGRPRRHCIPAPALWWRPGRPPPPSLGEARGE